MSSNLYPSLEDFKYDVLMSNRFVNSSNVGTHIRDISTNRTGAGGQDQLNFSYGHPSNKYSNSRDSGIYPSYMSIHMDDAISSRSSALLIPGKSSIIAPLSGYCSQVHKLQPSNTIRAITICKDSIGKVGLRLNSVQGGIFVVFVHVFSPAAMAGLKFGDQVLEINDIPVAGYTMKKVHKLIKKASPDELRFLVRDRPFERTVTLHKDQNGLAGFIFNKHGRIVSIVRDSSAARNGLLIDHNLIEINAQNVVGMEYLEIRAVIDSCGEVVILTIIPSKLYDQMIEQTNLKLLRRNMDHTAPEF